MVEKGLLFVLKGLVGNQFSECKYKLVGTTRTLLPLFWMRLNRFQGRSGVTERRSLSVWSPCSPRSHRGLFKPQHLSRFTTQLVEKPLAWRTRRGAEQRLETASRHFRALPRVIVCSPSRLFAYDFPQLITGVFARSLREYLYGQSPQRTKTRCSSEDNIYRGINCCRYSESHLFPSITVRLSKLNLDDELFHSFIYVAFTHGTKPTRQGPNRKLSDSATPRYHVRHHKLMLIRNRTLYIL